VGAGRQIFFNIAWYCLNAGGNGGGAPSSGNGYRVSRRSSTSRFGSMYGRFRRFVVINTGPTIRTTSGLCAPGASCGVRFWAFCCADFARFPWAKSATATPTRQSRHAAKIRRLKKADCEVDFFFIDEVGFPCEVEWGCYRICQKCVNIFLTFSGDSSSERRLCPTAPDASGEMWKEMPANQPLRVIQTSAGALTSRQLRRGVSEDERTRGRI